MDVLAQSAQGQSRISQLENQLKEVSGVDQIPVLCDLAEAYSRSKPDKAIGYLNTADKIASKNKANFSLLLNIYDGYGSVYFFKKKYKNAITYYEKAIALAKKNKVQKPLAYATYNDAVCYKALKNYRKAEELFRQSLVSAQKIKDQSLVQRNYHGLYSACNLGKKYKEAVEFYEKYVDAVVNSKQLKQDVTVLTSSYKGEPRLKLLEVSQIENMDALISEKEQLLSEMDSVLNEASMQNMELVQEAVQRNQEIMALNQQTEDQSQQLQLSQEQNSNNQEVIKKQGQVITWFIIIGVVFVALISVLLFMVRKTKRLNKRLENQNNEIAIQKNLIQVKNDQITDSINYARKIQDSILVPESKIKRWLTDMFIYYKPKDIVSGDFYWFSKYESKYVITAIDCTGHGVPGAFLSMIGNTLLHEIVNIKHVFKPDQILAMLHTGITLALNQDSEETDSEDGMDMSLCTVDTKLNRFQFAGAKNSLYVVQGDKLKILKANYYSIGGKPLRPDMKVSFTCYDFMYDENTSIYMFSDGYLDQFGGDANEKFNTQRFKDMIIENRNLPMEEQKRVFTETMEQWKGDRQQIDDFLVMGIKLSGINPDDGEGNTTINPKAIN